MLTLDCSVLSSLPDSHVSFFASPHDNDNSSLGQLVVS